MQLEQLSKNAEQAMGPRNWTAHGLDESTIDSASGIYMTHYGIAPDRSA